MLALLLSLKRELARCLRPGRTGRCSSRQTDAYKPCVCPTCAQWINCCLVAITVRPSLQITVCLYLTSKMKIIFKNVKINSCADSFRPLSPAAVCCVVINNVSYWPYRSSHLQLLSLINNESCSAPSAESHLWVSVCVWQTEPVHQLWSLLTPVTAPTAAQPYDYIENLRESRRVVCRWVNS